LDAGVQGLYIIANQGRALAVTEDFGLESIDFWLANAADNRNRGGYSITILDTTSA
jgi:hypothetical protein